MAPNNSQNEQQNDQLVQQLESWLNRPLIDTKWTKAYTGGDLINRTEVLFHPIEYMTTLVQLGFEPMPPKLSKSIFGRTQLQLPGFFSYMNYIIRTDGFFGIYRGLKYNIAYNVTYKFVFNNVNSLQKQCKLLAHLAEKDAMYANVQNLLLSLVSGTVNRVAALAVAYPIHVVMVRSISQFIGRETHYDSLAGAILDIYYTGGVSAFYSGFVPFLLGQCILLYLESSVTYLLRNKVDQSLELWKNSFVLSAISIISRSVVYPFKIVSTVMSCNGSTARSLAASAYTAPEYDHWVQCWRTLYQRGEIKRGSSLFWRYQPITSSLMFPMQPLNPLPLKPKKQI